MIVKYPYRKVRMWQPEDPYDDPDKRAEASTVSCECGSEELKVNWLTAPYTGGYLKVTCARCGNSAVILDDYS